MSDMHYSANWSSEDGEWVGTCAEFPSLSWLASTADEARSGIERLAIEQRAELVSRAFERVRRQHAEALKRLADQ